MFVHFAQTSGRATYKLTNSFFSPTVDNIRVAIYAAACSYTYL
jgi:hypothetical protein